MSPHFLHEATVRQKLTVRQLFHNRTLDLLDLRVRVERARHHPSAFGRIREAAVPIFEPARELATLTLLLSDHHLNHIVCICRRVGYLHSACCVKTDRPLYDLY